MCISRSRFRFEWDDGNREKCASRVPAAEIEALFDGRPLRVSGDPFEGEIRYLAIGANDEGREIFLVYTTRDDPLHIRPVSVHYIHRGKRR